MWEKFRAIFTIPELRQKIFFTLILLAVFRVGYQIPLPVVDQAAVHKLEKQGGGLFSMLETVSQLSAADLRRITIFGLGIMPYISASIILQLLGSVYKPLEDLRKEGETGRKKINEYTRYLTVLMCIIQGWMWLQYMLSSDLVLPDFLTTSMRPFYYMAGITGLTAGSMFLM